MNLANVQAVIESARSRGTGSLDRFLRERLPEAEADRIEEARATCLEIIDAVPVFLARAEQEAASRSLVELVDPILEHAERYFVSPIDVIPEMTHGLAGLLDDCYLVLRILRNLDGGPEPFLDWELDEPIAFLGGLVGSKNARKLDVIADFARRDAEQQLATLWERMGARA